MTKELGNSVWGAEIHTDHNGVSVTHQLFVDPEKEGDEPTNLPAGHFYDVITGDTITPIHFQNGPVKENGVNGVTNEALLAIVIHRTKILNDKFPCDENKRAISYMENALALFEQRTKDRQARGVEGLNKV
ncbi:hypothetical protein [Acinetobacter baumannii]|uniref:hypothetical protein n=1 Tax=Acinetobacter baumannii TaxID=470 RepID=UPI001CDC88E7|nr:hypothetical protein [Acinetobacter baumannii]MCA4232772.1 hypothetical protein [Acinetobacter baumannii]